MKLNRSALVLGMFVCLSAQAETAQLPGGSSFGEPTSTSVHQILEAGPLSNFETELDSSGFADEDMSSWREDQILKAYEDSVDVTNKWLESVRQSPSALLTLGQEQIASLNGQGRGSGLSSVTCLAMAIQGEAGGESAAGKAAVAATVMSRAGGQASRVCAVVFAHAQFESMSKHVQPSAESLLVARAAINTKKTCDYDHFINKTLQLRLGRKMPDWVRNMERRGCPRKQVGQHTFYKACACGY